MKVKSIGRNVTELHLSDSSILLISYETPVAIVTDDNQCIKTDEYWSVTTSKHINQFFNRHVAYNKILERPQDWFDNLLKSK